MYNNIGGKIKGLAIGIFIFSAIVSVVGGVILMAADDDLFIYGILIAILGILFSWLSSWLLYGFGQLIENSDTLVKEIKNKSIKAAPHSYQYTANQAQNDTNSYANNYTNQNPNNASNYNYAANNNPYMSNNSAPNRYCPHCGGVVKSRICDMCGRENNLF